MILTTYLSCFNGQKQTDQPRSHPTRHNQDNFFVA